MQSHHVISQVVDEKASRVFSEMENRYSIHGYIADQFPETAVVQFNDEGLIRTFKLYSCRSHLVMFIQKATGLGPYSEACMKYAQHSIYIAWS